MANVALDQFATGRPEERAPYEDFLRPVEADHRAIANQSGNVALGRFIDGHVTV